MTCEPSDAPTERTSALKPVASPVSVGGTASTIRFGIAANARPMPIEQHDVPDEHRGLRAVVDAHREQAAARR